MCFWKTALVASTQWMVRCVPGPRGAAAWRRVRAGARRGRSVCGARNSGLTEATVPAPASPPGAEPLGRARGEFREGVPLVRGARLPAETGC